ncbi:MULTISPECIES: anthranilate phosphoribosyltransferase [unclassified Candidatus Paralachnospira]|uniref:anthranilate phosphoribosyltransferase n=1 Tax=unclassified Candidatus Paralachnospira TaxID=3099471 RepID=UPI003F903ED8
MIKEAIYEIVNGNDLSYEMAEQVMDEIMSGEASQIHMGAFLTGLRMKGETIDEITACAAGMRKHCTRLLHDMDVLEIVGTGGDEVGTFNISTISSMVVSAAGIPVAKHGNRSVSSKCGAADVLEALGADITISPAKSTKILDEIGFCFLFAQTYHTAMRFVAPVRKELGIRTIFNILGPLANPAGANYQLLGVYDEKLVEPLAQVLLKLGVKRAIVVHGQDGLDEITLSAPTTCCELRDGTLKSYVLEPEQVGLKKCSLNELIGGDPEENAAIAMSILNGEKGPKRDAVVLNSAACIYMVRDGITLTDAVKEAEEILDNGRARVQLEKYVALSRE